MAISTNGTIITRLAGALYGEYLSNASYTELNTTTASTVAANMLSNDFAGKTDAQLAATILTNLGLSSITGLGNWVAAQLTAAGSSASAKGAKLVSMLNDYAMMTTDATYGASATSFNAKTEAALVKSQTVGTKSGSFATADVAPASSGTFTLTTGADVADANSAFRGSLVDSFRFTSGNETISAGISTLGGTDVFVDSSTTDTDILNATLNGSSGTFTSQNIETINANMAAGSAQLNMTNVIGSKNISVNGNVAGLISNFNAATTTPEFATATYTNTLSLRPDTLAGTAALATGETINATVSGASYGTTAATRSVITIDGTGGAGQLETLNITSSGSAGNVYQLNTSNAATLGTVNLLGAGDTTVRVSHADITGVTVAGALNTGTTILRIDRNTNTTTPTAVQNFTGLDKIQIVDSTGVDDDLSLTGLYTGAVVEALSGFNAATITVSGSAARTTDALTVNFDHATANTSVALGTLNVQDVETMNLVSTGNSSALVGAGNTATITGDATTVTITGDTSLNLTINVDAPTTGSRTTAITAAAVTGTATVTLNASGDSSTTNLYSLTGSVNGDTLNGTAVAANTITGGDGNDTITGGALNDVIDGGTGNDNITASGGIDALTGGTGNDTLVLTTAVAGTAAVQEVQTITFATLGTSIVAQGYTFRILGEDITSITQNIDTTPTTAEFEANLTAAINASAGGQAGRFTAVDGTGVVVTFAATEGDVAAITVRATNTLSTAGAASASATNNGTATVTQTSTGVLADLVDVVWSDFAGGAVDFIGRANLTLSAGGYYEGAVSAAVQATEYGMFVITDQSYASIDLAEAAINTRLSDASDDDMLVVFLDSALGYAVVFYDSDIDTDGAGTTNSIISLTGITTLSGLAAAFADTGTTFSS
jgi:hypothetical protein